VFRRSDGAVWQSVGDLSGGDEGFAHYGRMHAPAPGDLHLVWLHAADAGSRLIQYAHWDGADWSSPVSTGLGAHTADVKVDAERIHVFNYQAKHAHRPRAGGDWTVDRVGNGSFGFIGLGLDIGGRLHAAWIDGCEVRCSATGTGAASWAAPRVISTPGTSNVHLGLDVDEQGFAHVAWTRSRGADCPSSEECGAIAYRRVRP
jgi:hypothetical protein